MVRVGGGWVSLDEFLIKNDPCRGIWFFLLTQVVMPSFVAFFVAFVAFSLNKKLLFCFMYLNMHFVVA